MSREYIDILHTKLHSNNLFTRFFVLPVSLFLFSPLPYRNGKSIFREQKPRHRSCSTWWTRFNGFSDVQELVEIRRSLRETTLTKPPAFNQVLHSQNHCVFRYRISILLSAKSAFVQSFLKWWASLKQSLILSTSWPSRFSFHATNSNQKKKKKIVPSL